jgi:hypothetical protein
MWISVVIRSGTGADISVPEGLLETEAGRIVLHYGLGAAEVSFNTCAGETGALYMSPLVAERLLMRTEPLYQVRKKPDGLDIGPVLGLLLGNRSHWYDDRFLRREPERVAGVSETMGGLVCAFSPRSVSIPDRSVYGLYYHPFNRRWEYAKLPIPSVVHRRSFSNKPAMVSNMQALGAIVFNSRRYDKWELYNLLSHDDYISPYLPETVLVQNPAQVFEMLTRHPCVILKPRDLSRGRGIVFVERRSSRYYLMDCRVDDPPEAKLIKRPDLETLIYDLTREKERLCQPKLDLATVDGAKFDARVVMQRDLRGAWICAGIECRVAGKQCLLANVSRGGKAMWLSEAINAAYGGGVDPYILGDEAIRLCRRVCQVLEGTGETFAEFGMDVALDRSGRAWFIESNVIPTFHGFYEMDYPTYRRILSQPLLYAARLCGFAARDGGALWGEESGEDVPTERAIGPRANPGPAAPALGRSGAGR